MRIIDQIPDEILQRCEFKQSPHDRPDAPRIVHIEPQIEQCSDCNETVVGRTVEYCQFFTPFTYWRIQCRACRRIQNPQTGVWQTMGPSQVITTHRPVFCRGDK